MPRMKPEIKERWVVALRSGKYKQGKKALRVKNSFCCLGVLCDVVRDDLEGEVDWVIPDDSNSRYSFLGDESVLPIKVSQYAHLTFNNGQLKEPAYYAHKEHWSLASLNDAGASFKRLAKIIEDQF